MMFRQIREAASGGLSLQAFRLWLAGIATVVVLLCVATAAVFLRGESTRNVIERVDSACARAISPSGTGWDVRECQKIRREADRVRPLKDACIILRKTIRPRWFRTITFCPQRPRRVPPKTGRMDRPEALVAPPSVAPTGSPAPSTGHPRVVPEPSTGQLPVKPSAPSPAPPAKPSSPPVDPPPTVPPAPVPPAPTTKPARPPLIDLGPVFKPVCDLTGPLARLCP